VLQTVTSPPISAERRLVDFKAFAGIIGCSERTLREWFAAGRLGLPVVRLGRRVLFALHDIEGWIQRRKEAA
jgi:predicted DNA-binding transcriptional regulator AlpA